MCTFPTQVDKLALCLLASALKSVNNCPFCSLFSLPILISLFEAVPERSAEVLTGVPNAGLLACALLEKMFDKLHAGMSYSAAVGH